MGADIISGELDDDFAGVLKTESGYSLVPGFVEGEGQYCAAMKKTSGQMSDTYCKNSRGLKKQKNLYQNSQAAKWVCGHMDLLAKGEMITAVPHNIYEDVVMLRNCLRVVSAGCAIGIAKGNVVIPYADLALSLALNVEAFPSFEVDHKSALSYLHRDALVLPDAPKGYILICYQGLPLGFVKNLGNRCNSLHPQGRRIRMDIQL